MNHTGPAWTLCAFQPELRVPPLLDWQSRSTVPGAPVAVLDGAADGMTAGLVAAGPAGDGPAPAGPARTPRVTRVPATPKTTMAAQATAIRRLWRRCRRRMPSSSPAGGGPAAAAMAALSLSSNSV